MELTGALRNSKYSKLIDKIQYDNLDNAFFKNANLQCAVDIAALKVLRGDVHPSEKARAKKSH